MRAVVPALLSLSILLLLFGCAQQQPPVVQETPSQAGAAQQNSSANATAAQAAPCSTGNVVQKDDCFLALAKGNSDPQACRNIYSVGVLDSCYALFADTNLGICKMISNAGMKDACLAKNAQAQKSSDICNLIVDDGKRQACLAGVLPRCMLLNVEDRPLCMALEKGNYSICDSDPCLEAYAANTSDKGACESIAKENERLYCEAVADRNVQDCSNTNVSFMKDWCAQHAAEALGNQYGCAIATPSGDYSNGCYLDFAVKMNDSSICKSAEPESARDNCYSNYSAQTATVGACANVVASINQVGCYYTAARLNRMPSLCNLLQTASWRTSCYSMSITGQIGPLPSDCALVSNSDWRDQCYRAAALEMYNQSYCGSIVQNATKVSCDSLFGN